MANLITISAFAGIYDLSSNMNAAKKLDPCILAAQDIDICAFMGDAFYFDFIKNSGTAPYPDLLNGKEYADADGNTIKFEGIKRVLVHYSYARYIEAGNHFNTPYGEVYKKENYSQGIDPKEISRVANQARSQAYKYQEDVIKFLNRVSSDSLYQLWYKNCKPSKKKSFNISSIG